MPNILTSANYSKLLCTYKDTKYSAKTDYFHLSSENKGKILVHKRTFSPKICKLQKNSVIS